MAEHIALDIPEDGKLTHNITHFARALRNAGLPIGPGRVLDAIRAVEAAGFSEKRDFYWTLHACFVTKPQHRAVFSQIFRLYWRDPRYMEHMMSYMIPAVRGVNEDRTARAAEKRAAEALLEGVARDVPDMPEQEEDGGTEVEIDASLTMSTEEKLRTLDFEQMSNAEMAEAKRLIAQMSLPVQPLRSRRMQADLQGTRPDWRKTLRTAARRGDISAFEKRSHRIRWPNLVALCDISGSMSQYSRAVLHFLHTVSNTKGQGWSKVHAFTFGTRLTNITRHMGARDVDQALANAGAEAQDWEGGTRIGECLQTFNRDWSRRVMGQGAVVLLITDGLDREDPEMLGKAMERLHLSSRRLIWLNPLLRFDGFAPKAAGVRAMMPHVDCFRAGHNLASFQGLAAAVANADDRGDKDRMMAEL
ncbi:vWA domain-containing protein [Shimia ponticola]|uniref:vWA domain-containing protein n=1 Tax=Shimia ponticola TaxID=2582893 RepID=UPI0011BE78AE|nr:VWA domain-containing protein [Shimia ponticola]